MDEQKLRKIVYLIFVEKYTLRAAADAMNVSHMTVYRALQNTEIEFSGNYGRLYENIMNRG